MDPFNYTSFRALFNQPNGIAQLDEDGNMVGPIIPTVSATEAALLATTGVVDEIAWAVDTGRGWRYDETSGWVPASPHVDTTPAGNLIITYPTLAAFEVEGTVLELDDVTATVKEFMAQEVKDGEFVYTLEEIHDGDGTKSTAVAGAFGSTCSISVVRSTSVARQIKRLVITASGLKQKAATLKICVFLMFDVFLSGGVQVPQFFKADSTYDFGSASAADGYAKLLTDYAAFAGTAKEWAATGVSYELVAGSGFYVYQYAVEIPADWIAADGTLAVGMLSKIDADDDGYDVTFGDSTPTVVSDAATAELAHVSGYVEAT